jgi:hypothetical protein
MQWRRDMDNIKSRATGAAGHGSDETIATGVRLSREVYERLKARAEELGVSRSVLVNAILSRELP